MSMSNERLSFNLNSGVRLSGVNHSDNSKGRTAGVKHNATILKSNKSASISESLTSGLVRNKSATVEISSEGRDLAKTLRDGKVQEIKDKTSETRDSLSRVDELNRRLNEGQELTDEERDFINDELKKLTAQNYVDKRFHVMTRDDYEAVIEALQENMIQRIQLYSDMQKELESQKYSDEVGQNVQKLAEAEEEQSQKKRIVEILQETLEEDDEEKGNFGVEAEDKAVDVEASENGIIEFEAEEDEKKSKSAEELLKFRAIDLIDKNKEQIASMLGQSSSESADVREYNNLMDEELIRSYDLLSGDELSEEEKLKEFNNSWDHMRELHREKMVSTAMSKIDFDTWLISKIEFNSHNNIHEVLKDDSVDSSMGGLDMVREFLTNANPF